MEHVNDWCFRDIYKGGLWDDDLHVCARSSINRKFKSKVLEKRKF